MRYIEAAINPRLDRLPKTGDILVAVGIDQAQTGWTIIGKTNGGRCIGMLHYTGVEALPSDCTITIAIPPKDI